MYVLRLEANELQLIQGVLANATLNMGESNLRNQLWNSIQNQIQTQMPEAGAAEPTDPDPAED